MICDTGRNIDFKSFTNAEEMIPTKKSAIRNPQSVILYLSASLKFDHLIITSDYL